MKRVVLGQLLFGVIVAALVAGQLPVRAQGNTPPAQGGMPPAPTPLPPVRDDPWFGAVQAISAPQAALNARVCGSA
jgi:hypothetical protein